MLIFPFINALSSPLEDYPEFNLKNKGESMEHVPLKEQIYGTCYAYSASMAIDAYIYSNGFSDYSYKSDPIYLAAIFTKFGENKNSLSRHPELPYDQISNDLSISKGHVYEVFKYAKRNVVCMDNQESSSIFVRLSDDIKEKVQFFFDFYNKVHPLNEVKIDQMRQDNTYVSKVLIAPNTPNNESEKEVIHLAKELVNDIIPELSNADYKKIGKFLQSDYISKSPINFLIELSSSGCKSVDISNARISDSSFYTGYKTYLKKVSKYFSQTQNKQPLVITYCSSALVSGKNGFNKRLNGTNTDCGGHASLIIGARIKDNKYQYLIRDNYRCERSKIGECDKENVDSWVDAKKVLDHTYRINYLK